MMEISYILTENWYIRMILLNKLIEDIDKECFDKEAHEADIMLDRIMQQRQRCFDEYRYYKE